MEMSLPLSAIEKFVNIKESLIYTSLNSFLKAHTVQIILLNSKKAVLLYIKINGTN